MTVSMQSPLLTCVRGSTKRTVTEMFIAMAETSPVLTLESGIQAFKHNAAASQC